MPIRPPVSGVRFAAVRDRVDFASCRVPGKQLTFGTGTDAANGVERCAELSGALKEDFGLAVFQTPQPRQLPVGDVADGLCPHSDIKWIHPLILRAGFG